MTNGRPKKRGRPRKIKPIPVGDYAPKRVVPVKKKWYQKVWGWIKPKEEVRVIKTEADQFLFETEIFFRRVLRLCFVYFSMGTTLAILFVLALGEPTFISPVNSERGMERGYRVIPLSHPEVAHAEEIKPVVKEQPQTPKTDIERLVLETFGVNQYDTAMCIIKHESGGQTDAIGDQHLMIYDPVHNEYVGDSIGIMQIRTGGKDKKTGKIWNRARANGMTADEFRQYLKDPINNVFMGDKISGKGEDWTPWSTYKKCK